MSGKHTPGPWRAERRQHLSVVLQAVAKGDGYSDRVAECPQWVPAEGHRPTSDEAFANARLIASAPTMREFIAKRASEGDPEAAQILEAIDGHS